jgi:hypothetical protein
MSAIIAVAALIMFWWIYSAGRRVDLGLYPRDEAKCFTVAFDGEDFSNFMLWIRYLTYVEVYQLEKQGATVELFSDPEQLFRKYQKMPYPLRNLILRACEGGE